MLILSRVCVDFHDRHGKVIFTVSPTTMHTFQEAPDAIREDPIFDLLLAEGSMEATVPVSRQKALENDPMQGADATGKLPKAAKKKVEENKAWNGAPVMMAEVPEKTQQESNVDALPINRETVPAEVVTELDDVPSVEKKRITRKRKSAAEARAAEKAETGADSSGDSEEAGTSAQANVAKKASGAGDEAEAGEPV